MVKCAVGEKFYINIQEGIAIIFEDGILDIVISFSDLDKREIEDFNSGEAELNLCYVNEEMLFTCKMGESILVDVAYTPHLTKDLKLIEFNEGYGYVTNLFLLEANTNVIKSMRCLGPGSEFSNKLNSLIKKVKEQEFDLTRYVQKISDIQRRYSTEALNDFKVAGYKFLKK